MRNVLILTLFLFSCGKEADTLGAKAATNSKAGINVTSNADYVLYPNSNILDSSRVSFMATDILNNGDTKLLIFEFPQPLNLSHIELINDYTNDYHLGDLNIYVSTDSTNGSDGNWTFISSLSAATHTFTQGDGTVNINQNGVRWLRLEMTYTGTGAYGFSPSFYLSEINFY